VANYYESWYYNGLVRFSMRSKLLLQPKMMMPWQYLHYLIVYNTIIDGNFYYQNYFRYWRERPQTICKEDICMRIGLALSRVTFKKTWKVWKGYSEVLNRTAIDTRAKLQRKIGWQNVTVQHKTPLKINTESRCSWKIASSCSTGDIRGVALSTAMFSVSYYKLFDILRDWWSSHSDKISIKK
jgi:CDP-glycerol glycerophosphotransferase (TagB/SpsB family)